jgi:hypothetical protein
MHDGNSRAIIKNQPSSIENILFFTPQLVAPNAYHYSLSIRTPLERHGAVLLVAEVRTYVLTTLQMCFLGVHLLLLPYTYTQSNKIYGGKAAKHIQCTLALQVKYRTVLLR